MPPPATPLRWKVAYRPGLPSWIRAETYNENVKYDFKT